MDSRMDEAGIQKSIVMTMATGREFDTVYKLYAKYPDRFEVWCGLDYTGYDQPGFGPAAVKELERCHKAGAGAWASWAIRVRDCITVNPRHGGCTWMIAAWIRCWKNARS